MTAEANTEVADMEVLRHILGIGSHIPKRNWGYRNYFNGGAGHYDMPKLERLAKRGLVKQNSEHTDYWHATEAGALVAGLSKAQIKKMETVLA